MKTIRTLAFLAFGFATPCFAQADSIGHPRRHLCWRGRPIPSCTSFWITEFGYDAIVGTTQTRLVDNVAPGGPYTYDIQDFDSRFVWTVGPMFNTSPRTAIGGTVSIAPVNGGARVAIEGRRRWWIPEGMALDVSAGAVGMQMPHPAPVYSRPEYGMTVGAYFLGGDLINVNQRVDVIFTGGRVRLGTTSGVGLGSYAGAGGSVVLVALIAIAAATWRWD